MTKRDETEFNFEAYVAAQVEKQYSVPAYSGKRALDFTPFEAALSALDDATRTRLHELLNEASVGAIHAHFADGALTSEQVVLYYLNRIRTFDPDRLNSVIELNPHALDDARICDAERAAGRPRGPLHGIPVLLKDNVAATGMHNSAGAKALEAAIPDRDSFVVAKLRAAGAVLLGKANLSEWANFMTSTSNNGFSVLGGQTRNPYGRFDAGGSSSGSAVAVAADLTPLSIGSETSGSISYPSSQNSIVGIKPSIGLVSRDRVIPITDAMDTLGPMARNVTDAALLLAVIAGADPADPLTTEAFSLAPSSLVIASGGNHLKGLRIGMCRPEQDTRKGDGTIFDRIATVLRGAGAELIAVPFPDGVPYLDVLHYGMKFGVADYLAATKAPIASLAEVIAFNAADLPNRAPYGQDLLEKSQAMSITREAFAEMVATNRARAREMLNLLHIEHNVSMLVSLSNQLAPLYAPAGCPAVIVPAGYRDDGEPVGVAFVGPYLSEGLLINAAYGFEQAAQARRRPDGF